MNILRAHVRVLLLLPFRIISEDLLHLILRVSGQVVRNVVHAGLSFLDLGRVFV